MISTRPVAALQYCVLAICLSGLCAWSIIAAPAHAQQAGRSPAAAASGWGAATVVHPRKRAITPPQPSAATTPPAALADATPAATGVVATGDTTATKITFDLTASVLATARSVANPPRVIVDLPEIAFRLPPLAGKSAQGLITGYRFGLIAPGKSRIVIDTTSPVEVAKSEVIGPIAPGVWRLVVELVPTTASALAARELSEAVAILKPSIVTTPVPPRTGNTRPVIVVDAGHGGIDSGATGAKFQEKDVVLGVARQLRRRLIATRRYEVVMTRASDVFISLDERVAISRRTQADLFVSIHADSLPPSEHAASVRGATVYTLSDRASDAFAARMAEKENAVDLLAGLPASSTSDDHVRAILVDLMRRETATFSSAFRKVLIDRLRPNIKLAAEPFRSGPFRVLKQAGSPSVLIELGYMSNPTDERLMVAAGWQQKVADAIVKAIDQYFRTHRH
ncbi:MAG: N-acetylmuramoyl-L-alanine amidase [Hyphomicrobiaceae bacterium]